MAIKTERENQTTTHSLTLHYDFRFFVVVHENRRLSLDYANIHLVYS